VVRCRREGLLLREPKPIGELLRVLMERYRLVDPDTWTRIAADWDGLAGNPWAGRSKPSSLKGGELVVEASSPAIVAMLRYGTHSLMERLGEEFGAGVVTSVRIIPPPRR
jgi:predicted nucleic acid-binding Zn ribbon protein